RRPVAEVFIARAGSYSADLASTITRGMRALGITPGALSGKRVLLKPNLIDTRLPGEHINTHPLVVRGAAEAMRRFGASEIIVGEAVAHVRDSIMALQLSGLAEILEEDNIAYKDVNNDTLITLPNSGRYQRLRSFTFPISAVEADWIVSLPKMKTHHWAGVTLAMKNLFGLMPGVVYGWPKNVLHVNGIQPSILDINATIKPHFAIVDGIVGMEGDGPLAGSSVKSGVLVIGRNLPAVDATCSRIMGIDPLSIDYLEASDGWLGTIRESDIDQRGEEIDDVRTPFTILGDIPAQRKLLKLY
ncbi:MAG: DUF362 domain-containing protein, partial [Thermodesulfobacteriota bacterium]